jgi:hypothetical protein
VVSGLEDEGSGWMGTPGDGYIASNERSATVIAKKFQRKGPVRSRFQLEFRTLGHPLSIRRSTDPKKSIRTLPLSTLSHAPHHNSPPFFCVYSRPGNHHSDTVPPV